MDAEATRLPTPCRIALVGYGLGGASFHAPLIEAVPTVELAAVVTGDPARQALVRQRHPGARVIASVEELWAGAGNFDLAVITTPNRTHVPLARHALDRGLHVVVDKPMAPTEREARALIEHAARCGRMLTPYQNRRWDGDFMTVRQLIHDGRLGRIHRFESRWERWRPSPRAGWRSSTDPADAGGILFDIGSHLVDQALVLFGPAASVYAELDARHSSGASDDDAFVAITHASGVRSHLTMSASVAQPGPRFRLLGDKAAYVKWGRDPQELTLRDGARPDESSAWGAEDREQWGLLGADGSATAVPTLAGAYHHFYRDLAAAIAIGGPPPVDPSDAAASVRVIEAARRSAGMRVDL